MRLYTTLIKITPSPFIMYIQCHTVQALQITIPLAYQFSMVVYVLHVQLWTYCYDQYPSLQVQRHPQVLK